MKNFQGFFRTLSLRCMDTGHRKTDFFIYLCGMKIGNVEFGPYPVFLAPMEDVTDIGFRLLCKRMGAAMVYSEFVAADALIRMVNRSLEKLKVSDDERPVAIQIYGKETEPMVEAARIVVEQAHPDVLDLNFGCPVKLRGRQGCRCRDAP